MNKTQRTAVVDIGTNSTLYLIAESEKDSVRILDQGTRTTRLGRDIQKTGLIGVRGLTETVQALLDYQMIFKTLAVDEVIAVGTEVFRQAENRQSVLDTIRKQTGLTIRILNRNEEAESSFRGAVGGQSCDEIMVIDIGGGSTEMIQGSKSGIENLISYPIGAVTLTDRFFSEDPPQQKDLSALKDFVCDTIGEAWKIRLASMEKLLGVGGTVTTLSALHQNLGDYDAVRVHNSRLTMHQIDELLTRLCHCTLSERKKLLHLDPKRADIIIAGSVILQTIMELGRFAAIIISNHGLRYGIALSLINHFQEPETDILC